MKIIIFALLLIFLVALFVHYRIFRSMGTITQDPSQIETFCGDVSCATSEKKLNDTHLLIPVSIPVNKPDYQRVSCENSKQNDLNPDQLAPRNGEWELRKPDLLYDGIWKENVNYISADEAKNNWTLVPKGYTCLGEEGAKYGSNKLFNIRNVPIDGMPVPVDNCEALIKEENKVKRPRMTCRWMPEPDMEDILGYRTS